MSDKGQIEAGLEEIKQTFERRFGLDLSVLTCDYTESAGLIHGEVMVKSQYSILEKYARDIAASMAPYILKLDVDILAHLDRSDPRLPFRIPHNHESPVPLFSRLDNEKLTSEWLPADGHARLLHQEHSRWLLQLTDGAVGWCERKRLLKVQADGESGPFVKHMARGELLNSHECSDILTDDLALELSEKNIPYTLGGRSIDNGLDCSALIQHLVFKACNRILPRHTTDQMKVGRRISRNMLSPGDLIYCRSLSMNFMHVGIVVEDEQVVHACRHAGSVIRQPLASFYECYRFLKARRLTSEE